MWGLEFNLFSSLLIISRCQDFTPVLSTLTLLLTLAFGDFSFENRNIHSGHFLLILASRLYLPGPTNNKTI